MSGTGKSPWLIHYDGSSCNGCDIEVLAALTPLYDAERFGVVNTGNPKHADMLLVTGGLNEQNISVVKEIYGQMLEPKVVIACGTCACTGGIFRECYNILGGADIALPVDVYAPGCAVRPETIMDAVVRAIDVLEAKRLALKAGSDPLEESRKAREALDKVVQVMHWDDPDDPSKGEIDMGVSDAMLPKLAQSGASIAEAFAASAAGNEGAEDAASAKDALPQAAPATAGGDS